MMSQMKRIANNGEFAKMPITAIAQRTKMIKSTKIDFKNAPTNLYPKYSPIFKIGRDQPRDSCLLL